MHSYMRQPTSFVDPLLKDHVCRLHRSLDGLKQAPRVWFQRLWQHLHTLGFCDSVADFSLFIQSTPHHTTYFLVYVDDILVTGSSPVEVQQVIASLSHTFAVKNLGSLHYFLGIQATYSDDKLLLPSIMLMFLNVSICLT